MIQRSSADTSIEVEASLYRVDCQIWRRAFKASDYSQSNKSSFNNEFDEVDLITETGIPQVIGPIDWIHSGVFPPEFEYLVWKDDELGNFGRKRKHNRELR